MYFLGLSVRKRFAQVLVFKGVKWYGRQKRPKIQDCCPKIEDFSFRTRKEKLVKNITYIVPMAAMVKLRLWRRNPIWERVNSGAAEDSSYQQGFTNENEAGEIASQALNYALRKTAEEIIQDPEVEKNAASIAIDGLTKTHAKQKLIIPLRELW
jgi:flagellar biosynthesis/type III secretory pathway M-ring protein FliF/YscJ